MGTRQLLRLHEATTGDDVSEIGNVAVEDSSMH